MMSRKTKNPNAWAGASIVGFYLVVMAAAYAQQFLSF